jgi:hypothetical protein
MDNKNIKNGPTIHVINKDTSNSFGLANISFILEKFTFTKGGYIIIINPIANGILVVPIDSELVKLAMLGIK